MPPQISKQAGNGISRRHIQGSKTAKKLQSVKYSFYNTQKTETLDRIGARKGGTLWDFLTFPSQKSNKLKGGPLMEKNFKKVPQCRKTWKGDPLVSPGIVCYAKKESYLFVSVRLTKWINLTPYNFVELLRTILVSSSGLKKRH